MVYNSFPVFRSGQQRVSSLITGRIRLHVGFALYSKPVWCDYLHTFLDCAKQIWWLNHLLQFQYVNQHLQRLSLCAMHSGNEICLWPHKLHTN